MRVALIGCVASTRMVLDTLLDLAPEGIEVVAVVTKERSTINADFVDLTEPARAAGITVHHEQPGDPVASADFLRGQRPDVIYCVGWSHLLGVETLSIAPLGVIGFHPAALPAHRGRHPIIWALALGLEATASTFFRMDTGADSGPILDQRTVPIDEQDDAGSLYDRILVLARDQVIGMTRRLADGTATFVPQDESRATYWRKRSRRDGRIDWRMPAEDVHNLVRALAAPYPGAEFEFGESMVRVSSSELHREPVERATEPGRVLAVSQGRFLAKCAGTGAIWIEPDGSALPNEGEYL